MAALVHIAAGFASKPLSSKVPVWVMIVAAEMLDIFAILFGYLGIEKAGYIPWSHGLAMSVVWAVAFGILSFWIVRNYRIGILIGGLVLSHWVIDFITHPMGVVAGQSAVPDLPLLFGKSRCVGLGLYNHSIAVAYAVEFGTTAIGIAVYVLFTLRKRRIRRAKIENR
jgi:hypothetical protein